MRSIAFYSKKKNAKEAAKEIINQIDDSPDINPDLVLFYATLKYNGHYQEMLDIFKKRFGNIPQIGASVDGMIFPNDMRTDGAVLVLCEDKEARIQVLSANENGAIKSAEKLAKKIKCEKGIVILNFPLVRVPSLKKSAEFWALGRYYSFRAYRGDDETKRKMARRFSDYCDKMKIFFLPPTILEIFSKQLNYQIPIIGMNVMHSQVKFNSPSIFSNYRDIGDGLAALVIEKDNIELTYDDIFPEKGKTIEDTRERINKKLMNVKEFKAVFEKNILLSLDDKPPVKALEEVTGVKEKTEGALKEDFDKGSFQAQVPYMLLFFNKKTFGIQSLGIGPYFPFDMFPLYADINDFSDKVLLSHEPIYLRSKDFISGLYSIKNIDRFVFFSVDVGTISAFGNKVLIYKDEVNKIINNNYLGILSASFSVYLPQVYKKREYMTECKENIYFTACGNNIFIAI